MTLQIAVFVTGVSIATHRAVEGVSVELFSVAKDELLRVLGEHPNVRFMTSLPSLCLFLTAVFMHCSTASHMM